MSKIGNILKSLRIRENITQDELAEKIGFSRSAIGMYEQGRRIPPADILDIFADFYNVDMNYITGRTDEEYYIDLQTRQLAQEMKDNKELRALMDAGRSASKEDLDITIDLLLKLKRKERGD